MGLNSGPTELELKRQAIAAAYPSATWKAKVRLMGDGQVIAVYIRLKNKGKSKETK